MARKNMNSHSPDDTFCGVPNLTHTVKIIDTCAFAHGGFSDIWKGVEHDIECSGVVPREVAIKVIRVVTQEQAGLERLKTRISREVVSWCSVSHKNIVPFYGLCWLPGSSSGILPSMVYPYCPAGTCAAYLKNNPAADKMNIMRQVANGLVCLHSQPKPIVHGDIKASNVLMREDGTPMLADFGLSRVVMETSTGWTTSSGMGSYRWMAPQLLGGAEDETMVPVTVESDVWAFGCLCLEILTQCIPWGNIKNDINVVRAVSSGQQPPLPSELRSATLGHILQHCWAYEPDDRPTTSQLSSALYNDPLSVYNLDCALCPPKGISSDPPPALLNCDADTFTQTCDLSIFGEGEKPLVLRTKTPVALRSIDPMLFSPPLSTPSNSHSPSEPQAPTTFDSSNESTTPCVESVALTQGSQSSLGSAPQERPSVLGYLTRPASTSLLDIGRQLCAERIQKYRRVNNFIWPSGTRWSYRGSFYHSALPRIDSWPNLSSQHSQHSPSLGQLLMMLASSPGRLFGRSPTRSLQHTPITPNFQSPQQTHICQYAITVGLTSPLRPRIYHIVVGFTRRPSLGSGLGLIGGGRPLPLKHNGLLPSTKHNDPRRQIVSSESRPPSRSVFAR